MVWLPTLLILLVDVLTIVHIVRYHRNHKDIALWIILVIFLPILGPILYALVGPEPRPRLP
jgi:hypothetical protein